VNNNYNSNTVVKQELVVEEVDGRVNSPEKKLQHSCVGGGEVVALRKKFFPEKFFK
jgi:hypothetical protein